MTDVAALIVDLMKAGVGAELVGRVAAALSEREAVLVPDAQAEKRRAADRERKAALRKSAEVRGIRGTPPIPLSLDKENPLASPKEIKPKTPLPPNSAAFEAFWHLFPNKVGKADASKAFVRAEQRVGLDELMAGLRRYVAKTDDRPWCNPATWLNQDRWADQPAAVARGSPGPKLNSMQAAIERSRERRNADERQTGIVSGGAVLKLSDFSVG